MVEPRFRLEGLPQLAARLERLKDPGPADAILEEGALEVEARAARNAPVDEGRLRSSLGTRRLRPLTYEVFAGVDYAAFVEFGTGRRGAASSQPGGVPPEYVHGPKAGMPAQPFLRPALAEVRSLLENPNVWRDLL